MLKIGTIGFGGGPALIPLFEKELVHHHRILDEPTFITHTVIANLTPGAQPVKLAALAATQLKKVTAIVIGAFAAGLPGALATVVLLAMFTAVGPAAVKWVEFAAVGITAFILVLLGLFMQKSLHRAPHRKRIFLLITLISFLVTGSSKLVELVMGLCGNRIKVQLPHLNALGLILSALVGIGIYSLIRPSQQHDSPDPQLDSGGRSSWIGTVWFVVLGLVALLTGTIAAGWRGLQFLLLVVGSTLSSFGGGEAYVGVADGFFVRGGFTTTSEFYGQLVPVVNALPGPVLVKVVSGLSYTFGHQIGGPATGAILSATSFVAAISACCAVALIVFAGYDRFKNSVFMRRLGFYIMPVICGLLATTSCSMVLENMAIGARSQLNPTWLGWSTVIAVLVLWWLHHRYKLSDLVLLAMGGGSSLLTLGLLTLV